MDRILIEDLLVRCIIGVNEDERREKQDVIINIALTIDLRQAGHSDRLEDTIDYRALKQEVYRAVEEAHFFLIEALAEHIAAICLTRAPVRAVQVRVEKPSALRFARSVAVEMQRERA